MEKTCSGCNIRIAPQDQSAFETGGRHYHSLRCLGLKEDRDYAKHLKHLKGEAKQVCHKPQRYVH